MVIRIKNYWGISSSEKLILFVCLLFIKIAYLSIVFFILPDNWLLWSFDKNFSWYRLVIEIIPFILCCSIYLFSYVKNNSFSYFSTIYFILFYIPANSCLTVSNYEWEYYLLINLYSILFLLILGQIALSDESNKNIENGDTHFDSLSKSNRKLRYVVNTFTVFIAIICFIRLYAYNGLSFSGLFADDMYSVRADYATYVQNIMGTTVAYLLVIADGLTTYFLIVCLYHAVINNNIIGIILCLFSYLAQFALQKIKTTLLFSLIIVLVSLYFKKKNASKNPCKDVSKFIIIMFMITYSVVLAQIFNSGESILFSSVLRRETALPNYLSHVYYTVFNDGDKLWFSKDAFLIEKIMRMFIVPSYRQGSMVSIVSNEFFSGKIPSPNTGLLAEAYAQAGVFGALIFPFIHCYIIRGMLKAARYYGFGVEVLVATNLFISMHDGPILTTTRIIGVIIFIMLTKILQRVSLKKEIT